MTWRSSAQLTALIALGLSAVACGGAAAPPREQPVDSLLLVTIDTLRADHVSCYGASPVSTPNLDALAKRGALFERAWSTVPLTTPAHASILTGLYPPAHGVRNNARFRLPDDVTTLAEALKQAGRRSGAVVSSFTTARMFGLAQGFDDYDDDFGNDAGGGERNQRPASESIDRAIAWLESQAGRPVVQWVHLYDPHTPYAAPAEFASQYRSDPYSAEVAYTDAEVGRLFAALDRMQRSARTVIAVLADHGEGLGTHGEEEHGFLLYEETLHVPLIVAAPGLVAAGTRISSPVSSVDLMPTLLRLLATSPPAGLNGVDLFQPQGPARALYAETLYPFEEFGWSALYALRDADLKYIEAPTPELYDLQADPRENRSVATQRATEASALGRKLRDVAAGLINTERLASAAGFAGRDDPETIARLESLGYVAGGASGAAHDAVLPSVGGRHPHDAMEDLRLFKRAQDAVRDGDAAFAVKLLSRIDKADPDNPQILLKLAFAQDKAGDLAAAEATYKRLLARHPTFYLGTRSFSDFLEARARPKESRALWLRLAGLLPGYVGIESRTARAELAAGMLEEAKARLDAYLIDHPDDAEARTLLGRAHRQRGNDAAALAAYQQALQQKATEREALEGAVELLLAGGQLEQARQLVSGLVLRAPRDPVLLQMQRLLQQRSTR